MKRSILRGRAFLCLVGSRQMRLSEFHRAVAEEFGDVYSGVLLRDHWLAELGGTADEAISRGVPAREVWAALCVDLQVPQNRRYGRGLRDPRDSSS